MNREKTVTVMATINNQIVKIDLAGDSRNDYKDIKHKIQYLGQGRYYSYNGVRAKDKELTHFWKFKKEKNK